MGRWKELFYEGDEHPIKLTKEEEQKIREDFKKFVEEYTNKNRERN